MGLLGFPMTINTSIEGNEDRSYLSEVQRRRPRNHIWFLKTADIARGP
jgi:hypothetical protein